MPSIANKKTKELNREFATILALSYQPEKTTAIKLIPSTNPAESPIMNGRVLCFCCRLFFSQYSKKSSSSLLNMPQK